MLRPLTLRRALPHRHVSHGARELKRRASTSASTTSVTPGASTHEEELARFAKTPLHPLTLEDLVKYGHAPLSNEKLFNSANFALSVLPARLAHRIQAIRNLPFIVVTNPHISQIHNNYLDSFNTLLPYAEHRIETRQDEEEFTQIMAGLIQTHSQTIPTLSRGFMESRKYISSQAVTKFLDEHLRARIGTRLIAEQQVALHYATREAQEEGSNDKATPSSYIGIIDTALRPSSVIRSCEDFVAEVCELNYGVRPAVVINGEPDTCIAHIPVHLQYILTELLKNAFRATIDAGQEREPIEITIAPAPEDQISTKPSTPSTATSQNADFNDSLSETTPGVTIRIRDRGGGVSPENLPNLWTYGFTTFKEDEASSTTSSATGGPGSGSGMDGLGMISSASAGGSSLAGLGYGLPLGRAYAEYFGGGIALQSLWGWGTDVYLTLRGVGKLT